MRTKVKIIRFAAINSAIFAVFTYLITLNTVQKDFLKPLPPSGSLENFMRRFVKTAA